MRSWKLYHQTSKERNLKESKNSRGITQLSVVGKMLSRIIIDRIRSRVEYFTNISSVQYKTKYVNMWVWYKEKTVSNKNAVCQNFCPWYVMGWVMRQLAVETMELCERLCQNSRTWTLQLMLHSSPFLNSKQSSWCVPYWVPMKNLPNKLARSRQYWGNSWKEPK